MENGNVIFDLDGTLYDTEKVSIEALQTALLKFGIDDVTNDEIRGQFGEVTDTIVRNLVPDMGEKFYMGLKEEIKFQEERLIPKKGELYDGIRDILEDLYSNGYNLSICSNGRVKYINIVLETTGIVDYFTHIKGNKPGKSKTDQLRSLLEALDSKNAVMVGDRYHDIEAAKEVGIPSIGAAYGFGREEVESADFIATEPLEIYKIVKKV
ncbi:MAG: HAD family hydrolase [Thermoplasmata archaeon]